MTKVDLHLYINDVLGPDDYFGDSTATVEWSLFTNEKTYGFSVIKPNIHKLTLNSEFNLIIVKIKIQIYLV